MEFVKLQEDGFITTVTVSRVDALNALNTQVLLDLEEAVDQIDPAKTRVVIVTGEGDKSFVAGADIKEMVDLTVEEAATFADVGKRVFQKIEDLPMPVIAEINGYSLGGGLELALSCDIRYASESAKFSFPEVGLGILPGFGGTQRLMRVIGSMSVAKELVFSTKMIGAEEAKEIGLISSFHAADSLHDAVLKLAGKISLNAPIGVKNAKASMNKGAEVSQAEGMVIETENFAACFSSLDQKEGMTAFLEKRKEKNFKNQ